MQNNYNLAHRHDDALIDDLARLGIAYVPFFRSAGSRRCSRPPCHPSRGPTRGHADAGRAGVAAAPVAQHPLNSRHVVTRPPPRESGRRAVDAVAANLGGVGRDRRSVSREILHPDGSALLASKTANHKWRSIRVQLPEA